MPQVSGYDRLPAEHRAWLLREWRRTGYGDNARVAEDLAKRLASDPDTADFDAPDPSTVWRWARAEKRRASEIRYIAELRAATVAALPAEDPALLERIGQHVELYAVQGLEDLERLEDASPRDRISAAAEVSRANTARRKVLLDRERAELDRERAELDRERVAIARERWEAEQAARREEREKAAGVAEAAARSQGVSPAGIEALRAAILGAL